MSCRGLICRVDKRSASTNAAAVDALNAKLAQARLSTLLKLIVLMFFCAWGSLVWADDDAWWLEQSTEAPSPPTPLPLAGEGSQKSLPSEGEGSQKSLPSEGEGSQKSLPSECEESQKSSPSEGEESQSPSTEQADGRTVEVVLVGLPEYLQADVRASLTVQRQRKSPYLDDLLVGNLAQRAEEEAAEAMQASGFYRAKVVADVQTIATGWRLTLNFTLGPIVRITEVNVVLLGGALEQRRVVKFGKTFPLVVNAPLVHPPYEDFKRSWLQLAQDEGFLDARYSRHEIVVDPATNTAQVFLTLESGMRYAFGNTRFEQAAERVQFEQALLDGYLPWKEGEPYRVSRLLELQRTLSESRFFAQMDVAPTPNRETHTVDVLVNLSARKQTAYSFGLGYGTDTGARASAEVDRRYLNARGDRFHGKLSLSQKEVLANFELRRPWIKPLVGTEGFDIGGTPSTDFFSLGLRAQREELDDVVTNPLSLQLLANDVQGSWRRQARLVMLYEEDEITNEPNLYGHMLLPGLNVLYRPRVRGRRTLWSWDVDAQTTLGTLLSSTSLAQLRLNGGMTVPVREFDQVVLRGSLGTSWSGDFNKVPISLRYFTGGDQSVRGYAYKSLGASNAQGNGVGGEHLLVMSAEYQWMFKHPFGMAAFVDTGNAFNGTDISLKTGAGLGALWRSPVGMIGLYLAHGFQNEDEIVRLHFSLGAEF